MKSRQQPHESQTWVIGSVGLVLIVIGLVPAFTKLFH